MHEWNPKVKIIDERLEAYYYGLLWGLANVMSEHSVHDVLADLGEVYDELRAREWQRTTGRVFREAEA